MESGRFTFKGRVDQPKFYFLGMINHGEKEYQLGLLLDKDRKIIAKDLLGSALENKLHELMNAPADHSKVN
jgi:hypothetical protein